MTRGRRRKEFKEKKKGMKRRKRDKQANTLSIMML